LFEVQRDQICDVKIPPVRHAGSNEKDMRNAVTDFQPAIAGEAIVECDPAKGESFCRAWTFEIFIERGLRNGIRTCPAITGHDEGRNVRFITEPVHKI